MYPEESSESNEDLFFVSWGDLVTLLMVFFVYLFAISEIDPVKFVQAKDSLNKGTQTLSSYSASKLLSEIQKEEAQVSAMAEDIQQYLVDNQLEHVVSVKHFHRQLSLNLGDSILFDSGSADLKPSSQALLSRISSHFKKSSQVIVIEGHTDDMPIHNSVYPSNWELSSARAASVARFLISQNIDGARISIVGYDQYQPLVKNTSVENRAKNRRVTLILKPSKESV